MTLVVQWTDVTQLDKNATLVFPESVRVSTRDTEHYFSMFLNINDTFKLMEQLANIAMRQLLDNEGFAADRSLPKPCKTLKNVSALKRFAASFLCAPQKQQLIRNSRKVLNIKVLNDIAELGNGPLEVFIQNSLCKILTFSEKLFF